MRIIIPIAIVILIVSCRPNEKQASVAQALYQEPYRPKLHFTPKAKWMNDPNGMVFIDGTYHLFYQHYPDSTVWGPMHWGHATSKDLLHWEHRPIALYPDSLGMIFSGSAVYDSQNSSGLGTSENPPIVAIFTYHFMEGEKAGKNDYQTQGLAYSLDKGQTWSKYKNNPVLKNPGIKDFRDPKIIWHEDSKKWVMILAVSDHVEFYGSSNLIEWNKLSEFGKEYGSHGGVWECPDLFQLTAKGESTKKWVMLLSINPGGPNGGSATQYFVGHFDGIRFTSEQDKRDTLWVDYGPDNYAGVTWSNIPKEDGRRIFLGWMSNWAYANVVPTSPWRSAMTIPRELALVRNTDRYVLTSTPVSELQKIVLENRSIKRGESDTLNLYSGWTDVPVLSWISGNISARNFRLELRNDHGEKVYILYDEATKKFTIDRSQSGNISFSPTFSDIATAPRLSTSDTIQFSMIVDVSSVEVFFDKGKTNMTSVFFPQESFDKVFLTVAKGGWTSDLEVRKLEEVWKKQGN